MDIARQLHIYYCCKAPAASLANISPKVTIESDTGLFEENVSKEEEVESYQQDSTIGSAHLLENESTGEVQLDKPIDCGQ